ncbi:MAG: 3'-phosphoesterase [Candidatus Falkowbacteria bacterium]|nr:3'-phosphoesterase [Candidatus Falkowbacteria bacterium]
MLNEYQKKRNFSKTKEPVAKIVHQDFHRFVVQKHQARNLHYDFRLEMAGVLKSWAVPKGIPEKSGIKRLAVEVEDHPVDYINFSGTIPAGEYGAGVVKIWDQGKWRLIEGALGSGSMKFNLEGKKLNGEYVLVRLKNTKNWLIYKIK